MDFDKQFSRPVVKSISSAQAEWEHWLYENHFQRLLDADGLEWELTIHAMPTPDEINIKSAKWNVTLSLAADVDAATFTRTGVLDTEEHERLLAKIGDFKVPLRMKPIHHEARGENEARDLMMRILPDLRDNIAKTSMVEMKRNLLCRWIDDHSQFGAKERLSAK